MILGNEDTAFFFFFPGRHKQQPPRSFSTVACTYKYQLFQNIVKYSTRTVNNTQVTVSGEEF